MHKPPPSNCQIQEPFCGADGFGIPLKFSNASDYLFASLFLNDDAKIRIPWEYCDSVLFIFNDPRFKSQKDLFKLRETSSPTQQIDWRECFREEIETGKPSRFVDASDDLFAHFFLHGDFGIRISWVYCGTLLSTLRDSRFDPEQITFRNFEDMYRQVGEYRDEAWSLVEARNVVGGFTVIPQVVLDGVFDVLRFDLENPSLVGFFRVYGAECALKNMALVHSSWHGRARRIMGYAIVCRDLGPRVIQNPSIGRWTRRLNVTFRVNDDRKPLNVSKQYHFLRLLCSRIPYVRVLQLEMPADTFPHLFTDAFVDDLYKSISSLALLESITLQVPHIPPALVKHIAERHHKTLQSLQFITWDDAFERATFPSAISPLTSLPNLRTIHISSKFENQAETTLPAITDILWSRNPSKQGAFIPSKVRVHCFSEANPHRFQGRNILEKASDSEIIQTASHIDFFVSPSMKRSFGPSTYPSGGAIADAIAPVLGMCTSSHKIAFHDFSVYGMNVFKEIQVRVDLPNSVEELFIVSSPPNLSWDGSVENSLDQCSFYSYDTGLSEALGLGLAPGLRELHVLFIIRFGSSVTDGIVEQSSGVYRYHDTLPKCKQVSTKRGINFHVGVKL